MTGRSARPSIVIRFHPWHEIPAWQTGRRYARSPSAAACAL